MGIYVPAAEITIRNDAPDSLRNDLLVIMKQFYGLKKIRNVVTVVAQKKKLILNLPLDVSTVSFEEGFSRAAFRRILAVFY